MLKTYHTHALALKIEAVFEVGNHLLDPSVLRQATETCQRRNGLLQLLCFRLADGLLVDAEIGVFVAVVFPFAFTEFVKLNTISRFTFHEAYVIKNLPTTHATLEIDFYQGFFTFVDKVFDKIAATLVTEAAVKHTIADIGVFIDRHKITT